MEMQDNANRNFKGQNKNEVVICFTRKHWIVLLPHFVIFSFFVILTIIFFAVIRSEMLASVITPPTYRVIALAIIIGQSYLLHRFFLRLFNYYLQVLIITSQRVVQLHQTIFFNRNRDSVDLPEIQDLMLKQNGLIKTIFNYGEIEIVLSSAHATKDLHHIPNPEYYFKKINKTKATFMAPTLHQQKRELSRTPKPALPEIPIEEVTV